MLKVWIDAGHGGADSGNAANGYRESDLVLQDAAAIAAHLIRAGAQVRLSRNKDVFVGLSDRANAANDWGADIFVSIHINGATSIATGIETWYYSEKSKPLAATLQRSMVDVLDLADRGLKQKPFTVIYKSHMPAVLLEQFFLENTGDLKRYLECRENLRVSIAKAILAYLGMNEQPQPTPKEEEMGLACLYQTQPKHIINPKTGELEVILGDTDVEVGEMFIGGESRPWVSLRAHKSDLPVAVSVLPFPGGKAFSVVLTDPNPENVEFPPGVSGMFSARFRSNKRFHLAVKQVER